MRRIGGTGDDDVRVGRDRRQAAKKAVHGGGISPAAVKASAGAVAHVKLARGSNTSQLIGTVKEHGYWVAGLDAGSSTPIWQVDLTGPIALVLGNEQKGLHSLVKKRCDLLVSIPVRGDVTSYNVSVSAGIALYECLRQRATLRA